ncbi:MAG: hypothetical protein U5K54_05720 [Cytophagales bacterium]|nr:hypothetical protein [Cytophagales bacterium]
MEESNIKTNPFIYSTPDRIRDPQEATNLFVDVFKDFYLIESPGNTFIHGARGSGKSMMFRIMRPDCQKLKLAKKSIHNLNYYAIYIPIKDTSLNIQELNYLQEKKHIAYILNEHLMCLYFSIAIFKCLAQEEFDDSKDQFLQETKSFFDGAFNKLIRGSGFAGELNNSNEFKSSNDIFSYVVELLEGMLNDFSTYIQRLILSIANLNYSGSLCLYRNFLLPLIKEITQMSALPKEKPLYLLIDDADLLSSIQTQILNSWVSFRSTSIVCFKVSTQLNYKTYWTANSHNKIDSPHDYHEINLSEIYTSNSRNRYRDNLKDIVERRLKFIAGLDVSAEKFFPANEKQEIEYRALFKKLEDEKGYDYAYRNARLDYMLSLTNKYSYSYAGFDQLVHLSSGIIRNFVDLSFKMFDKATREKPETNIQQIPVIIQNQEIRTYSDWILEQLDKSIDDSELQPMQVNKYASLRTLIDSIGKTFRMFLKSEASERRKFSFYYDGNVSQEIKDVLQLGVSEGLLHYSKQGSKTGLGRSHKYVINRILSPAYELDPFSFTGYLYLTPEKLELAVKEQKKFLAYIEERIKKGDLETEQNQLELEF